MESLTIIKIGGHIIDEEEKLSSFLDAFAALPGKKILVHGGGKLATRIAEALGIPQQLVDGRRITDAETLKVVTMVYAGFVNKHIVSQLQARACNAVGLSGADGNAILAHKRGSGQGASGKAGHGSGAIDYGFAGDVDAIDAGFLQSLLGQGKALIMAPITHNGKGQLLNTNADTIARELAGAMGRTHDVSLVYSFEKSGVLSDAEDDRSVIPRIDAGSYRELKDKKIVFAGMIPKLDNAFAALDEGAGRVIIGKAEELEQLLSGQAGTTIVRG